MHRGARVAGTAVPSVFRETHVPIRSLLPEQARLGVHCVGARQLLPGAARQARPEAAGALANLLLVTIVVGIDVCGQFIKLWTWTLFMIN